LVAKIVTDNSNSSFFWPDQEMELYQWSANFLNRDTLNLN
jgi:hypothetical protein